MDRAPMRHLARHRTLVFALVLIAPAAGCEIRSRLGAAPADAAVSPDAAPPDGAASPDAPDPDLNPFEAGPASDGASGGDASHGGGIVDGGIDQSVVLACVPNSAPQVAPASMRRLTNFEYDNTVRDILNDTTRPATTLLPFDGWFLSPQSEAVSTTVLDGYHQLAHDLAIAATKDAAAVQSLTKCNPAVDGEAACQKKFIETFVPVAFRRPLETTDSADFDAVFSKGRELTGTFAGGVRAVVEVVLQSPEFLYRVELGQPADAALPGVVRLTPHETAVRLSYLLWGSVPDAALRDAAAAGKLQTKAEIAAQAQRMVADVRARELVRYFYLQLFNLNAPGVLTGLVVPPNAATFTAEMPALLFRETSAFIDEVTWQGPGDFQALMTAPFTFMNGRLAQFYGVSGISGDAWQKVAIDPNRRIGILTQGGVLAATSFATRHSPVIRGTRILQRILCVNPEPPPPNVITLPPDITDPSKLTTRQKLEMHLTDPTCRACHKDIDPLGFAFEHFDRFGLWRDTENGLPIDTTGEIYKTDAKGRFDGAVELATRLAQSRDVQNCYVGNWMRFGYGREPATQDACSVRSLQDAFAQAKGNVRELLVALTQTDAFLYKSAP